ncbi:DUF4058 family protein [Kovacikia minuta CCNUW1]|uniref:DUF4058 family protein n=1 Tax=Kovacikia minuta TaxID=2931930 RepID=UPI001CCACF55|nr:DUF4058 family protein [Kovacikia minuta]UBF28109.1 DUF4058 family protein [Kovacikia minuta CCNUW1]
MPSPFPGMNPYLENPELWSEFHSRMIVAIADALDDLLSRDYRVAVEKRVYLSQDDETILIGIPDVAVTASQPANSSLSIGATAVAEPLTVELPASEEVQERYLEIREGGTGIVVTTIELLSPKNKRSGEGRNAYLQKRQQTLNTATHWIEIDLLRGGEPMPMLGAARSDYRILVSRSQERPKAQLYAFSLRQPIPAFPIPLRRGEPEPLLELQPLLHHVYDRARFELEIDYQQPPSPKLSNDAWEWLRTCQTLSQT